jgi:hypothetical protein
MNESLSVLLFIFRVHSMLFLCAKLLLFNDDDDDGCPLNGV